MSLISHMVSVDVKHHAHFNQIAADAHSERRFPAPFSWLMEGCRKLTFGFCGRCSVVVMDHTLQYISLRLSSKSFRPSLISFVVSVDVKHHVLRAAGPTRAEFFVSFGTLYPLPISSSLFI